jgi:hypothetical protein
MTTTTLPFADSVKTGLPASGWYANRLEHSSFPGVPTLCCQVRPLADEGFTIGVHTASHAPLSKPPAAVQRDEMASCAPREDYTDETLAIATGLGFTTGFTTHGDFARPGEPALERSRFVVLAAVTAAELAHRIAYAWPR